MESYPSYADLDSQWLNTVPAHWRLGRLDQVARAWPSNVDKHSVEGEPAVRLCNYTDVYKNSSIVEGMDFMRATASQEQVDRFRIAVGDTLLTKDSETADDIGVPAFVEYEAPDLVCGYHLSIVRPATFKVDPKFLYWALGAQPTLGQWAVLASGVSRVGLKSGDLAKVTLALPPLIEQRAIAHYLDRETTRIDTLIEEQQRLIELLDERRRAVVVERVTKGSNPDVEVSETGVQWIGEVPSHWAVKPLRRIGTLVTGSTPPTGDQRNFADEENDRPWVRPQDLRAEAQASAWLTPEGWQRLRPVPAGSVLVGCIAYSLGSVGQISEEATTNQQITSIIPEGNGRYMYYVMCAARDELWASSQMNRVPILNNQRLGAVLLPVPPPEEQRLIADDLDAETAKIDALITETERFIELSRERRSALITAAVTGQIDVREVA